MEETQTKDTELTKIEGDLLANGYPFALIRKAAKKQTMRKTHAPPKDKDHVSATAKIPYTDDLRGE